MYQPICMYCIKCLGYTHFRAIQVTHLHDEMGWCSYNNSSGLTLQHTVFHVEAPLSNTYEEDMVFAGMTFSSLSLIDAHRVYPHRIPSIASRWINLMLDSLTSAPVDSINESPLSFFSITTSSGSPNPVQYKKRQCGHLLHCKWHQTYLIVQYSERLRIKDISNLPIRANGLNKWIAIYLK